MVNSVTSSMAVKEDVKPDRGPSVSGGLSGDSNRRGNSCAETLPNASTRKNKNDIFFHRNSFDVTNQCFYKNKSNLLLTERQEKNLPKIFHFFRERPIFERKRWAVSAI